MWYLKEKKICLKNKEELGICNNKIHPIKTNATVDLSEDVDNSDLEKD